MNLQKNQNNQDFSNTQPIPPFGSPQQGQNNPYNSQNGGFQGQSPYGAQNGGFSNNNMQQNPQRANIPINNGYSPSNQPPPPAYYQSPASYTPPQKSNSGTTVLIVAITILLLAVGGVLLWMFDIIPHGDKDNSESESTSMSDETDVTEAENQQFLMPNLIGQNINDARATLEGNGFVVGIESEFNEAYPENTVIGQDVAPDTVIEQGSTVVLKVSSGPEVKKVTVPNVVGNQSNDAMATLQSVGLTVSFVYEASRNVPDYVLRQDIAPNTQVPEGSVITLTISQAAPSQAAAHGKVVTKTSDLNVRGAASMNGKILGTVARNSTVEIVGQSGNWYQIKYNGGYGFVSKDYVIVTE